MNSFIKTIHKARKENIIKKIIHNSYTVLIHICLFCWPSIRYDLQRVLVRSLQIRP